MAAAQPLPASSSPQPNRFSVWNPGSDLPRVRPPSLLSHLRVKLRLASLAERERYEHALWQSGKAPAGGDFVLLALRLLAVLLLVGAVLGMVWLQLRPDPTPAPDLPPPEGNMEVFFVFDREPGTQSDPARRIGAQRDERP